MSKNGALETILLRNAFYRDNYTRAAIMVIVLVGVNLALVWGIFYKVTNPPPPQYFATTADGRIINTNPLKDPVVSDSFVLQWTANRVRQAFSQDYIHWRQQLQEASSAFTPQGWRYFLSSMKASNNLETLVNLKMVSNAEIIGAPRIVGTAILSGRFAWKIQMPVLVTYANSERTIPTPMDVTLIVVRMSVKDYPARIAINNFLPEPRQSTATEMGL